MKNAKLIIASNNAHKLKEIKQILGNEFAEVFSLSQMDIVADPDETGSTFLENALIKVNEIAKYAPSDYAVLADDSGLCVDALDGAPGVLSARFSGVHGDDAANIKTLLNKMQGVEDRSAGFVCCVALRLANGDILTATGTTRGRILLSPEGDGGFGYDPVFFSDDLNCSFGVATPEQKNAVSHRGRALEELAKKYAEYLNRL